MRILKIIGRVLLVLLAIVVVMYLGLYLWSLAMPAVQPVALSSQPDPAQNHEEAMARFDALLAEEKARGDIDEVCLPYVMTHGERTARAIILCWG